MHFSVCSTDHTYFPIPLVLFKSGFISFFAYKTINQTKSNCLHNSYSYLLRKSIYGTILSKVVTICRDAMSKDAIKNKDASNSKETQSMQRGRQEQQGRKQLYRNLNSNMDTFSNRSVKSNKDG